MSAIEGNKMAKSGKAAAALATAALGSFVAGTIGTVAITFVARGWPASPCSSAHPNTSPSW